ncbi:DUF4129 domain-containing protein [Streptomyces sp. NPDC014894]|uniref:DUF4129 domain-containing protein n=1 Tax=Streptomyces sp. NPDC014894 TaxID=3364931 RepID=UPI003700D0E8
MLTTGGATARPLIRESGDAPVDTPRTPAREAAERELSRPMYHENDPNLLQRAHQSFWDWVGDLLSAASTAAPGGLLGIVVILLAAAGLLAALWWRLGTPRRTPATPGDSLFGDVPLSASQHRTTAETHAGAHRWNEAVQERMRAVVRSLEERALLEPRPGRTAGEAAAEGGRSLPGHAGELRAAARSFDDVTYGGRPADDQAYRRLRDLDLALEDARPLLTEPARGGAE